MKKRYHYKITVHPLDPAEPGKYPEVPVTFETENHDNILAVMRRTKRKLHFDDESSATFALGLKLLAEAILKNRDDPLFTEIKPALVTLMRNLKVRFKNSVQTAIPDITQTYADRKERCSSLGIKSIVEKSIQEIEERNIAFPQVEEKVSILSEIEVNAIDEMDDSLMAEFAASTNSHSHPENGSDAMSITLGDGSINNTEEILLESDDDGVISISSISGEFSLSSELNNTQYTIMEKLNEDGSIEEIQLYGLDDLNKK